MQQSYRQSKEQKDSSILYTKKEKVTGYLDYKWTDWN